MALNNDLDTWVIAVFENILLRVTISNDWFLLGFIYKVESGFIWISITYYNFKLLCVSTGFQSYIWQNFCEYLWIDETGKM